MDLHIIPESDGAYSIIIYIENFLENTEYNQAINNLKNIEDWKTGDRDGHVINRVQKWYHVDKQPFSKNWRYEWPRWESHYYDNWLLKFQDKVSEKIKEIQRCLSKVPDFGNILIDGKFGCETDHLLNKIGYTQRPVTDEMIKELCDSVVVRG